MGTAREAGPCSANYPRAGGDIHELSVSPPSPDAGSPLRPRPVHAGRRPADAAQSRRFRNGAGRAVGLSRWPAARRGRERGRSRRRPHRVWRAASRVASAHSETGRKKPPPELSPLVVSQDAPHRRPPPFVPSSVARSATVRCCLPGPVVLDSKPGARVELAPTFRAGTCRHHNLPLGGVAGPRELVPRQARDYPRPARTNGCTPEAPDGQGLTPAIQNRTNRCLDVPPVTTISPSSSSVCSATQLETSTRVRTARRTQVSAKRRGSDVRAGLNSAAAGGRLQLRR